MKNELMIDIETTGQNPGCKVLTIGAFGFGRDGNQCEFYRRFNILKLVEEGFQDDLSTMDWWRKKDKEVFDEAFGGKDDPKEGIADFKAWCYKNFAMGKKDDFKVWSCGTDFDFPILKHFFRTLRLPFPVELLGSLRLPDSEKGVPDYQVRRRQRQGAQCTRRCESPDAWTPCITFPVQGLADVQVMDKR